MRWQLERCECITHHPHDDALSTIAMILLLAGVGPRATNASDTAVSNLMLLCYLCLTTLYHSNPCCSTPQSEMMTGLGRESEIDEMDGGQDESTVT